MFGDRLRVPPVNRIKQATAKDFSGGLNTVDSPLNLSSKYCVDLRNMYPEASGRLRLRYGTTLFATIPVGQTIVNMEYYAGVIVVVTAQGNIYTVTDAGVATLRALPPPPDPQWATPVTEVNFSQFGGNLIICDGVNQPIRMVPALTVNYLVDAGTGLNTFVPRAKFMCTHNNYNVAAGMSAEPSTLSISSKGTDGTFIGAAPPNDGVKLNLATYINIGDASITGIVSFRDQLIVTFEQVIVSVKLGTYSGAVHTPIVEDVIENVGALSHRSIVALGDDVVFQDLAGVSSVKRALITATLSPVRESGLISDRINVAAAGLSLATLSKSAFAIHDRIESQVLFFMPKVSPVLDATDNNVFVYNFNVGARYRSFTYFDQLAFRCGCRTQENRIFFGTGRTLYRYQSRYEESYGDLRTAPQASAAVPTPFRIETPWTDLRDPVNAKLSKYLQIIAEGSAQFTVDMYVDRQPTEHDLSIDLYASDAPNASTQTLWYWSDSLGQWTWSSDTGLWSDGPLIRGKPAISEQLYAWPTKFKRAKFVIYGTAVTELGLVAITMMYQTASIRR
ncbi:hypothetical protein UFOVP568_46 [uncultured Caudovirales phage]|uniref:Uncharacterized protein n=1 Tax=uncultured Caudovirales phage TaxID=2100421 RepID=A0A6J5N032_9CAUD|nr:hypothetical protein UFOVP568_46 [uncultured Caudovirales phage]